MAKKGKRKKEMSFRVITALGLVAGLSILLMNFMFFSKNQQIYAIINLVAMVTMVGMPLSFKYSYYKKTKKIEMLFPKYLRDVAENISVGMTLPQAMKSAATNDYDVLTPYVRAMSNKIEWGIPLDKVLLDFAAHTGSKSMKRNIQTINEAHRSGGTIDTILKSVAQSLQELEIIKKERSTSVYSQMVNGYMIYVIFLGVMIALATVLVPTFNSFGGVQPGMQEAFNEIFTSITIIQGFFAGIAIGKMAEGSLMAGIKHSLVLVIFGYSMFLIFT